MTKKLYYNPSTANADLRKGMGYGKAQKTPSLGTGLGSEAIMGSSETGIYSEPSSREFFDDDPQEFGFDDDDIDNFVSRVNLYYMRADPSHWPRADRGSLAHSSNIWEATDDGLVPAIKPQRLPKARKGISPFSSKTLYPKGFNGPPLGTGNAGQAFKTTGPFIGIGTQYGTSRAPINTVDDGIEAGSYLDILDMDPSEREILKQRIKMLKILNTLDEGF